MTLEMVATWWQGYFKNKVYCALTSNNYLTYRNLTNKRNLSFLAAKFLTVLSGHLKRILLFDALKLVLVASRKRQVVTAKESSMPSHALKKHDDSSCSNLIPPCVPMLMKIVVAVAHVCSIQSYH